MAEWWETAIPAAAFIAFILVVYHPLQKHIAQMKNPGLKGAFNIILFIILVIVVYVFIV